MDTAQYVSGKARVEPPVNETCDDCGTAKSLVAVVTKSRRRLTFCGHDFDKIAPVYKEQAFLEWNDTRS